MVTVLLFFLSFLVPPFAHVVSMNWQQRLQAKLLMAAGTIKSEFEIEKALVLFTNCLDKRGSTRGVTHNRHSAFGITGLPSQNQHLLNESNTNINKQVVGLILFHRERCRDFRKKERVNERTGEREKTCFCMQFDDSLIANRIIQEDSKRQWESNRFKSNDRGQPRRATRPQRHEHEEDKAEEENLYDQQNEPGQEINDEGGLGASSDISEL